MNLGRILIAGESNPHRTELRNALEFEGYTVAEVETAEQTIQATSSGQQDALLLDSGSAGIDLRELCREVRLASNLGMIVVDRGGEEGPVDALNAGADDYIAAPFVLPELMARVRAVLRRVARPSGKSQQIVLHDRAIDLRSHKVKGPGDRVIHLTPKEFEVLTHLVVNANKPLTHQSLAQAVWRRDAGGEFEYVRIVIKQLRRKLEPDPENPRYICTERAVGYWFNLPAA